MTDEHIIETVEPEAAFSTLADATRLDILQALWEAEGQTATFSKLRETVGTKDSGKFNYHLQKLTEGFVRKTESGYELRAAGRNVVGALVSGAYTMTGSIDPMVLDDPCPACAGELTFDYEDERVRIECGTCPFWSAFPVPPGALADHPVDRFPTVADRYVRTLLTQARLEFCSQCYGRVEPSLQSFDELPWLESKPEFGDTVAVSYDCDRCGMNNQINLATIMLDHPEVSAFHHEHGIDVRDVPIWHMGGIDGEPQSTLLDDDAAGAARVTYIAEDDRLTLTVEDSLAVVDVERSE